MYSYIYIYIYIYIEIYIYCIVLLCTIINMITYVLSKVFHKNGPHRALEEACGGEGGGGVPLHYGVQLQGLPEPHELHLRAHTTASEQTDKLSE